MRAGTLPAGSWGFDANAVVSPCIAKNAREAGYSFVMRYVRRSTAHAFDLSSAEFQWLLGEGLAVGIVQHVAAPGWLPTALLGDSYGSIARQESEKIGYPEGANLWCDLEGVSERSTASETNDYNRHWYAAASQIYAPGLYVGDSCGLTATELYRLPYKRYWRAFNTNADQTPIVRGFCMKQKPYPPRERRILDAEFEYDEDVVMADAKGDLPIFALP